MTDGLLPFTLPVADPEGLAAQEAAYAVLADSVRRLVALTVQTRIAPGGALDIAARLDDLADDLAVDLEPGPLGLRLGSDGRLRDHANPAAGIRNPIAPPLRVARHDDGSASCEVTLGPHHEGPPGHVHGGIIALVLDQVLGTVPAIAGLPGMTAYLNLTYRRPTPLGPVRARARIADRGEWKVLVTGELTDTQDEVLVEAEGLFVVPRAARDRLAVPMSDAGDFPFPGSRA